MLTPLYILILKASPEYYLTKNFTSKELQCKCSYQDCNHSFIYRKSLNSLQSFRDFIKKPIYITSAHRCQRHNHDCGGLSNSFHLLTNAFDIAIPYGVNISDFANTARDFFDVVIEYPDKNFIHCHNI
jgi:uncharacterized protein YcbK (DUF882 family)